MLTQFLIVLSALFVYNLILRSIGAAILKAIMESDEGKKQMNKTKSRFQERLEEMKKQQENK